MFAAFLFSLSIPLAAQDAATPLKAETPRENEIWEGGVTEDSQGEWKYLKGAAEVRTAEMTITADAIDFNSDTNWAYARGHVRLQHFATGDVINADHAEFNLKTEEGKFYAVSGTSPAKIMTSPGILTTSNPFYYQAQWADRIKNRFILHKGFITDCKVPKPWWVFEAPLFDIVPGQRAIARHTVFRLRHVPILYLPYFYRALGKNTRQSGFLTPNLGHSTTRGYLYGGGYYWAIDRSYDLSYIFQYYSLRGPAQTIDFRGKPNSVTDFNVNLFTVQDKGVPAGLPGAGQKQGGSELLLTGRTQILGFTGRVNYDYLTSLIFRAAFTYNYSPQTNSIGFLQRHFGNDIYALNFVMSRTQVYEDFSNNNDQVILQKLPSVETSGRLQQLLQSKIPLWFSYDASSSLLTRREPTLQTGFGLERTDLRPTVSTAFSFKGFSLYPSATFEATDYGEQYSTNTAAAVAIARTNLFRRDADFVFDFRLPALEHVYRPAKWLHLGDKLKHVIEAEAQYEFVTGIEAFQRIIHFDETDIVSNTNQLTIGLTNRFYKKEKNGTVREFATWRLRQARYFDPTFGGTIVAGQRNVNLAQDLLSPYTFLDGPRSYSPIVSSLLINPYSFINIEYRASYDPLRHKFLDHTLDTGFRFSKYFATLGETTITTDPILFPATNQLIFGGGYGATNRRGLNAAATVFFDLLLNRRVSSVYEVSYNSDCCGFSFEWRSINNFIRNDNQYLFSFQVANIGSFGNLPKQGRIF